MLLRLVISLPRFSCSISITVMLILLYLHYKDFILYINTKMGSIYLPETELTLSEKTHPSSFHLFYCHLQLLIEHASKCNEFAMVGKLFYAIGTELWIST